MNPQPVIKRSYVVILILVVVGTGALLFFLNRPATLKITTETGADISISDEKGGEFKSIGKSQATYKTREYSKPVYVQTTNGNKKTISGARLTKGETTTLDLKLVEPVTATTISEGSVYNTYIEGTLIQGIVPDEYMVASFRTDGYQTTRAALTTVPYVKKIVWYDKDNFVYSSLRSGIGQFIAGKNVGNDGGIATKLSGVDLPDVTQNPGSNVPLVKISDISKSNTRPLVLVSDKNLFLSDDLGTTLRSIAGFKTEDGATNEVFATQDYIFKYSGELPAAYADETGEKSNDVAEQSIISQYTYDGEKISDITINDESIVNVTQVNDTVYVLTPTELVRSNSTSAVEVPMYFTYVSDITTHKSSGVILADEGVWKISDDGVSMQLLYDFNDNGVGLAKSFTSTNGALIFGTTPKPEENTSSRLLSIEF